MPFLPKCSSKLSIPVTSSLLLHILVVPFLHILFYISKLPCFLFLFILLMLIYCYSFLPMCPLTKFPSMSTAISSFSCLPTSTLHLNYNLGHIYGCSVLKLWSQGKCEREFYVVLSTNFLIHKIKPFKLQDDISYISQQFFSPQLPHSISHISFSPLQLHSISHISFSPLLPHSISHISFSPQLLHLPYIL